jgi:hypothetical protein
MIEPIVVEDLGILCDLIAKAANKYQVESLQSTYGTLAGDGHARQIVSRLLTGQEDATTGVILNELFCYTGHPKDDTMGWWNSISKFVRTLSSVNPDKGTLEFIDAAYDNEGFCVDIEGLTNLQRQLLCYSGNPSTSLLLTGELPKKSSYDTAKILRNAMLQMVRDGHGSHNLGVLARTMELFYDFNVPEGLCLSMHENIQAHWEDRKVELWHPLTENIGRYLVAGKQEREYMELRVANGIVPFNDCNLTIANPLSFEHVNDAMKKGGRNPDTTLRVLSCLGEDTDVATLFGYAITGRKSSYKDMLAKLDAGDSYGVLIRIAELAKYSKAPISVMKYFHKLWKDAIPDEIYATTDGFYERDEVNTGKRAWLASKCGGARLRKSIADYQPKVSTGSIGSLNALYDMDSGLEHLAVLGEHIDITSNGCKTTAFVNLEHMPVVVPNAMMFDPSVGEDACSNCRSVPVCRGMEDYYSLVLFNAAEFDPKYLDELASTVPGQFELHVSSNGIHRLNAHVITPTPMMDLFAHPNVVLLRTPVDVRGVYTHMAMFPHNISGSSYLARNLHDRTISGDVVDIPPEVIVATSDEFDDYETFQGKISHFTGREINVKANWGSTLVYHPSLGYQELSKSYADGVTIEPTHPRKLTP